MCILTGRAAERECEGGPWWLRCNLRFGIHKWPMCCTKCDTGKTTNYTVYRLGISIPVHIVACCVGATAKLKEVVRIGDQQQQPARRNN